MNWSSAVLLVFGAFLVCSCDGAHKKLPSFVNVCKRFDPEIAKCWAKTLEGLRPHLIKGIPEFKIPPVEPFFVEKLHLDQGSTSNINFVADLMNTTFAGGKDFKIVSVSPDYRQLTVNLQLLFPRLVMKGRYKAKGRVLLFQFDSDGDIEGDFKNVFCNGSYILHIVKIKGKDHMQILSDTMDVKVDSIYLYMHDLFRNNPEITKNVNLAINDNIDVLYEDFKPLLHTTLSTILRDYANRVYSIYPFDVLLPIE